MSVLILYLSMTERNNKSHSLLCMVVPFLLIIQQFILPISKRCFSEGREPPTFTAQSAKDSEGPSRESAVFKLGTGQTPLG